MSRVRAVPVEVRHRDGEPEQFVLRGRLFAVREVLARWSEAGGWWQGRELRALAAGDAASDAAGERGTGPGAAALAPLETAPIPSSPKWAQRAWGEPAPDVGAAIGPAGLDDRERSWWRVEAGAGAASGTGVYDLCCDVATGAWVLARVID